MQRFRGGLVFKAHRLFYHSTLGLRVIKKKEEEPARSGCASDSVSERDSFSEAVLWFRRDYYGSLLNESRSSAEHRRPLSSKAPFIEGPFHPMLRKVPSMFDWSRHPKLWVGGRRLMSCALPTWPQLSYIIPTVLYYIDCRIRAPARAPGAPQTASPRGIPSASRSFRLAPTVLYYIDCLILY